ncbi:MAG TPA: PHB depolymerase family esterase [Polaromonas sp.]|uniref:extracellular catalytic domain type 1 short-chain-length polyhydroxyalkanoate depolymerase n=1 Tax=Polaromonas sp. TaxID=1869339 RepID=UPI002D2ED85F|nr:PHB depolymerase family esterase [Polaromonas sp.]HYW58666.1 PHB depolymerase family esterase [Polaromonas sp.]
MAKSLSSLWLKSIKRLSKSQQTQGRKLLKSMLPKPVRAPVTRRPKAPQLARVVLPPAKTVTAKRKTAATPAQADRGLPGTWQKFTFPPPGAGRPSAARRLLYWLYLPASARSDTATQRPVVVMLHGCQQTALDFATSTRMNKLAERKGFAVLYPQQSATKDSHRCWHWYQRTTQQGQGEAKLIAEMTIYVQHKHGLDASRTYIAGLSAGAALATIVALRYPRLFAAVGLHSAPVFGTTDSAMNAYRAMQHGSALSHMETARALGRALPQFPGMPAILIHGVRDDVVRRINVEQLTKQLAIVNAAYITRSEPVHRKYTARTDGRSPHHAWQTETYYAGRKPQLVRCDISTLGHAWSGGDSGVAFSVREGPNATLMMWNFFALHHRRPTDAAS